MRLAVRGKGVGGVCAVQEGTVFKAFEDRINVQNKETKQLISE